MEFDYFELLQKSSDEELSNLMADIHTILEYRENERFQKAKENVINALKEFKKEFPSSSIFVSDVDADMNSVSIDILESLDFLSFYK